MVTAAVVSADQGAVAARVNGVAIPTDVVDNVVRNVIASSAKAPSSEELERVTQAALDSLIDLELLYQEAQARKISVSNKDIDDEIARTRARFGSDAEFEAALKGSGLSLARLRTDTRKTLMVNRLLASLSNGGAVSEQEIDQFYEAHRAELEHPTEVRISEIVLKVQGSGSVGDRAAALQRANTVLAELRAPGSNFAAVARAQSDDAVVARQGGDRGFVRFDDMPPPLATAAENLQVGQVSEIIEGPDGYHIISVTEVRAPDPAARAEARARISKLLAENARDNRQASFVKSLRDKAKIEMTTPTAD